MATEDSQQAQYLDKAASLAVGKKSSIMPRPNATENSGNLDETSLAGISESAAGHSVRKRRVQGSLQGNPEEDRTLATRCWENQQDATAAGRSTRSGASAESSHPRRYSYFEVFDDSKCHKDVLELLTADTHAGNPSSPLTPVSLVVRETSINATAATPVSPECDVECQESLGEASMILDTSLHTGDIICYSDLEELESDVE